MAIKDPQWAGDELLAKVASLEHQLVEEVQRRTQAEQVIAGRLPKSVRDEFEAYVERSQWPCGKSFWQWALDVSGLLIEAIQVRSEVIGYLSKTEAQLQEAEQARDALQQIVNQQAEDAGLWFIAKSASEGYLQQELRKLHAAIEAIVALDLKQDARGRDDFYSGPDAFFRAHKIAREALRAARRPGEPTP